MCTGIVDHTRLALRQPLTQVCDIRVSTGKFILHNGCAYWWYQSSSTRRPGFVFPLTLTHARYCRITLCNQHDHVCQWLLHMLMEKQSSRTLRDNARALSEGLARVMSAPYFSMHFLFRRTMFFALWATNRRGWFKWIQVGELPTACQRIMTYADVIFSMNQCM